jgi:hypothetical protein
MSDSMACLSSYELEEYNKALKGHPLSLHTSAQFFLLYLQGYSVADIVKVNPSFGSLGLGLVLRARIDHGWDLQKEQYVASLMTQVRETVQKTQLEAIRFASDGMAVYHKMVGDKYRRYLQTGNLEDLGDLAYMSFKQYKEFAELTLKLTGQKVDKQEISGHVTHTHVTDSGPETVEAIPETLPDDPVEILKMLEGKKL